MPACCSVSITARVASGEVVGFSREVPRIDPPRRCTRDTSSIVSGRSVDGSRRTRCLNPSRMPMTSKPSLSASMVAAEMTALMPGAGPPPTRMPRRFGEPMCPDSRGPVRRCQLRRRALRAGSCPSATTIRWPMSAPWSPRPKSVPRVDTLRLRATDRSAGQSARVRRSASHAARRTSRPPERAVLRPVQR